MTEQDATPEVPQDETASTEATAPAAPVESDAPTTPAPAPAGMRSTPPDGHWWWGTGRRKAAVARVRIRPGSGKFLVNKRPLDTYFTEERDRNDLNTVLQKTRTEGNVDIHVNVRGGGFTGQAGAILLVGVTAVFSPIVFRLMLPPLEAPADEPASVPDHLSK